MPGSTSAAELQRVLRAFGDAGIDVWIEGGWGVDALLGRQTREHGDVDLDIRVEDEGRAITVLEDLGYALGRDQRLTRMEWTAEGVGVVDLHPLRFSPDGDAVQIGLAGEVYRFSRRYFTAGTVGSMTVGCFTAEAQRVFHSGYPLRDVDREDLARLPSDVDEADAPAGVPGTPEDLPQ